MSLTRAENWPELLLDTVEDRRSKPFAWGENDCALFAADCVLVMTGEDFAAPFRGRYSTAAGSIKALKKFGGGSLEATATAALGEPILPRLAQRGDVVLFLSLPSPAGGGGAGGEGVPALAVCVGSHAAAAGPDGVTWVPMDLWLKAWRV